MAKQSKPETYSVEQIYQLATLLDLSDQALLLQHLTGAVTSRIDTDSEDMKVLYGLIYKLQKKVNASNE